MIKPTWVIFDVGGVLFDYLTSFTAIAQHLGVSEHYLKQAVDSNIGKEERGSVTLEDVFTTITSPLGKTKEIENLITMWYDQKYWNQDTLNLMSELKKAGYRIAIMTNNWGNMGDRLRAIKGIEVAEKIYESAVIGKRKPDLEFYQYITADLTVEPDKIFLIDDLPPNCEGALQAGWQSHLYSIGDDHGSSSNTQLRQKLLK